MAHARWIVLSVATVVLSAPGVMPSAGAGARAVPMCGGEPATVVGTAEDDVLRGTEDRDVVLARGGDDVVRRLSVDDVACGGPGADRLFQDPDAPHVDHRTVFLYGDAGRDRLVLTFGQAHGGDGDDVILAGAGNRQGLYGEDGDDLIRGGEGRDSLDGGDGDDRLYGGPGPDYLRGETGADLLVGGQGKDSAEGGRGGPDVCKAERAYATCERPPGGP